MRAILTCLLYAVIAFPLMAETRYEFELSVQAREYRFPRPLFERAISAENDVILVIRKTKGKTEHFFYIDYILQCGQDKLQSYAFSPFPVNAGGRFILPRLNTTIVRRLKKNANNCQAKISLQSRAGNGGAEKIKVSGYMLAGQDMQ